MAYASDRYGNFDIFTIPASGGVPSRITANSAQETPFAFSNDGRSIYFGAAISDPAQSTLFPKSYMEELYRVSIRGGRYERVLATPAQWICLSERSGSFNVWNMPVDNPSEARQATFFKTHPVRFPSISRDGTFCFVCNGEICTMDSSPSQSRNPGRRISNGGWEVSRKFAVGAGDRDRRHAYTAGTGNWLLPLGPCPNESTFASRMESGKCRVFPSGYDLRERLILK